ncbi:putative MFS-type transporter YfkF [Lysinibacillus alkalisoli]|uniref:MFS-type transporter YfkF n=1 Tax=Lysinibacillus alkalisoli TaxID=1911548 RepID=A0A917G9T9_9BACI|nr:MFS transporter [Lysinibacillus alkalisoli]GGG32219.1 putative MFS-type transporter YfkF [Lysinibacillus alkalisoli]
MKFWTNEESRRFWIIVAIVSISGFSQGMLLPLISVIFEQNGVSSTINGLHATGLYIGVLLISPFLEQPLRKFGYKPIILIGGATVFISLMLFPLWQSIWFWFALRLIIGVGDQALHIATQTWVTSSSERSSLGKSMAIYGLSFSMGFAVGPLMVSLLTISQALPFILSSVLCLLAWSFVFFVKNERPERLKGNPSEEGWKRYKTTIIVAWVAFLGPFVYGFLESSLNALFPVYALRNNFNGNLVPIMLSLFTLGGILTQIPLGMLGDKIGRRKILLVGFLGSSVIFFIASLVEHSEWSVLVCFFLAGTMVSSVFSQGISYMADLTPKRLLPTGNLLCGIAFSIGSLIGPVVGGVFIEHIPQVSFLVFVAVVLLLVGCVLLFFGKPAKQHIG